MDFHFFLNQFGGVAGLKAFVASLFKTMVAAGIAYVLHKLQLINTPEAAAIAILFRSLISAVLEYGKVAGPSFDGSAVATGELA